MKTYDEIEVYLHAFLNFNTNLELNEQLHAVTFLYPSTGPPIHIGEETWWDLWSRDMMVK
jgi:hypothetical protein